MHRLRILATIVVVSVVVAGGRGQSQTATPPDFSIGVVRSDGTLLPIAARQKGTWQPLLRAAGNSHRLTQAAQRQRAGWMRRMVTGRSTVPVTLGQVVNTRYECTSAQAFAIDNYGDRRTGKTEPVLNVGIAVVGPAAIELPQDVTKLPDDASRQLAAFVTRTADAVEADVVRRRNFMRTSEPQRGARTFRFERLYRHRPDSTTEWTYFEGVKPYSSDAVVYLFGWVRTVPSSLDAWRLESGLAGTEYESRPSDVLGIVRSGPSNIWLHAQYSNIDEGYGLFDANEERNGELTSVLEVPVNHCNP